MSLTGSQRLLRHQRLDSKIIKHSRKLNNDKQLLFEYLSDFYGGPDVYRGHCTDIYITLFWSTEDVHTYDLNISGLLTVQHNNTGLCKPGPIFRTSVSTEGTCPHLVSKRLWLNITPLFSTVYCSYQESLNHDGQGSVKEMKTCGCMYFTDMIQTWKTCLFFILSIPFL